MTANVPTSVPPGVPPNLVTPQGNVPAIGIGTSQDYPRLVFTSPYFETVAIAEIIQPSVTEAIEAVLPSLVPPYVDASAQAAVQQLAVLLTGSTMSGPLFLNPLMPTADSQAATKAYVDTMLATAGIPEVPPVPAGQVWARETGQWVPITPQTGVFLPLSGGSMTGNINMSGNTIQNMAAVPAMPNGAAPAQWVLNQIASVSLYQGTWDADTNVPDLTQLSTHVNAYTWIALTSSPSGVVISPPIPGLQGMTVFNGDTIIYSTVAGAFSSIHAGGITLPEADGRYVQLAGSQMSGALLLNANASQPLQAVTLQQLQAFVPPGAVGEAPNDGQLYGRNGLTTSWAPVLPLAGGILTGAVTLAGNAVAALNPVPLQQMTSAISAGTAGFLPLAGGTMTGLMSLSANASTALNPVPLQQLTSTLASYTTQTQLTAALASYSAVNYVDNSGFSINQRAYTTGTALGAGAYGFDRWKAGASGCTLTFAAQSGASVTVTISAGSLTQVIEGVATNLFSGANLITGTYTLSWSGTATARSYQTGSGPSGAYAASPIQVACTAGQNQTIEFTGGTLGQVQLQLGTQATGWKPESAETELSRCQRCYVLFGAFQLTGNAAGASESFFQALSFPSTMRATPTMNVTLGSGTNVNTAGAQNAFPSSVQLFVTSGGAGYCLILANPVSASADL